MRVYVWQFKPLKSKKGGADPLRRPFRPIQGWSYRARRLNRLRARSFRLRGL